MAVFETKFPVRYYETDLMGVVHHSNYIRYFENARSAMLVEMGFPVERCEKEFGIYMVIASFECHLRHPARMGDVLTAQAEVTAVPLAKMVIGQKVFNEEGELCAEGSVTLGFIDKETFRPVRCPEPLCDLFAKYLN